MGRAGNSARKLGVGKKRRSRLESQADCLEDDLQEDSDGRVLLEDTP